MHSERSLSERRALAARIATVLALCGSCGPGAETIDSAASGSLNVVVITLDTTRADALGVYGQPLPTSPNIDRMAAEGVLFSQAASSAPTTLPSHSSIFTGRLPFTHGVRANVGYALSEENVTLAETLQEHGYRTAAEIAASVMSRRTQMDQGFGQYRDVDSWRIRRRKIYLSAPGEPTRWVQAVERDAADIARLGIEFLRQHSDEKLFLWLHFFDPHQDYRPPDEFMSRIPSSPYHAEVLYTDHHVGRVLEEMRRLGLDKRTLTVLTADHGEGLGQHNEDSHSLFVYDTTVRVPLILWGPDFLTPGKRIDSLVRTIDVTPTILDLLGLPPLPEIQGISLRPLLEGESGDLDLLAYGESIEALQMFGASVLRYVRLGDWKYIHKPNPELYDVLSDPGELRNLASVRPEKLSELRGRLEQLVVLAPKSAENATAEIDAQTRAQLHALGYVGAGAPAVPTDGLDSLNVGRVDARDKADDMRENASAWGLMHNKDFTRAEEILVGLRSRNPESIPILMGYIAALTRQGKAEEAIPALQELVERTRDPAFEQGVYPEFLLEFHVTLAEMYSRTGQPAEAKRALEGVLEIDPCFINGRVALSQLHLRQREYGDQGAVLRSGMERCPDTVEFVNDYAYTLATSPDHEVRDGGEALRLARRLMEKTDIDSQHRPAYLDTLAAAHAEAGDFGAAAATLREAIVLLRRRNAKPDVLRLFEGHLALFESGEPVRETGG